MFSILTREGLISFLYFLPALLLSLSIHEFGHAYTAYKLGDKSQKALGRLTLSPFRHIDIVGFECIALFGFGWGKPVMVDDRNFKKRGRDNMLVALAGPMSNLALALVVTLILKILSITNVYNLIYYLSLSSASKGNIVATILTYTIEFNVVFAIFNLIPFPPFDGSKILYYFLPYNMKKRMDNLERYSILILLILFLTPITDYIIAPAYGLIYLLILFLI